MLLMLAIKRSLKGLFVVLHTFVKNNQLPLFILYSSFISWLCFMHSLQMFYESSIILPVEPSVVPPIEPSIGNSTIKLSEMVIFELNSDLIAAHMRLFSSHLHIDVTGFREFVASVVNINVVELDSNVLIFLQWFFQKYVIAKESLRSVSTSVKGADEILEFTRVFSNMSDILKSLEYARSLSDSDFSGSVLNSVYINDFANLQLVPNPQTPLNSSPRPQPVSNDLLGWVFNNKLLLVLGLCSTVVYVLIGQTERVTISVGS